MVQETSSTVRLKVSPEVARVVGAGASHDVRLAAARGALPLAGKDLLTALFFLANGRDVEVKQAALTTLINLPVTVLTSSLDATGLHPKLLELIARLRISDCEIIGRILVNPDIESATLRYLARHAHLENLQQLFAAHQDKFDSNPELVEDLLANPRADQTLKARLKRPEPQSGPDRGSNQPGSEQGAEMEGAVQRENSGGKGRDDLGGYDEKIPDEERSKYQMSLDLKVAEKIKVGLTGDKEWRNLLIKDANKLVQGAVLKNPRITDGEVIMVARNKQSSDEMIRLILLNKDWMKLYEIKKALVWHPKTPLPKALRLVGFLNLKDLKDLVRSRNVQTAISTAARKELERKQKRV